MRWWPRRGTGRIDQADTAGITVANTGVIASITIGAATYLLEDFPLAPANHPDPAALAPSRLLAARHQLVPFTGRDAELQRLAGWRDGPAGVAVQLVYASGGQGKSRLAAQFAAASAAEGWLVWQARYQPTDAIPTAGDGQSKAPAAGRGVLLVADYAERWPVGHHQKVLGDGMLRGHGPVRVLLLARPAGLWWTALRHELDKADAATDEIPLAPLAPTREDRRAVFRAARDRFAELLDVNPAGSTTPVDLDEDDYARVLSVHMAALVAVDAAGAGRRAPADAVGLSSYLLDREHAYWQDLHTQHAGHIRPRVMGRAVFLATLTRPLPREQALGVLRHVELASSAESCEQIIDDHAACYPPADTDTVFEPLYPDRLGEDFLALQLPGHTMGSYTPDGWTTDALPRLLTAVDGHGAGSAPQHLRNTVTVLIEAARRWPHVAREAVTIYRRLAEANPTAYLPNLATSMNNLGLRLSNLGRREQALAPTEEAVTIYRRLAEANPTAYLPDLAASMNNLGILLSNLGRQDQALIPTEEAVTIYRRLAEANPAAYLPDLARGLWGFAWVRATVGLELPEALAAAEEAIAIYQRLVEETPEAFGNDLLSARYTLANILDGLGRHDEAAELRRQIGGDAAPDDG